MIYKIEELKKKNEKLNRSKDGTLIYEICKNKIYSIAYGELLPGEENKLHRLDLEEIYTFLAGNGEMVINDRKISVSKDTIVTVPKNATQKLRNLGKGKLCFIMNVIPQYDQEKDNILE